MNNNPSTGDHVLVTGAMGFVGRVLVEQLHQAGFIVTGTSLQGAVTAEREYLTLDVCDANAVERLLERVQPTHIIHLAAITHVPTSFDYPQKTWQTNVMGTLNILQGVKKCVPNAKTLFVSSSEVYGAAFKGGQAIKENSLCLPMNPYAASKLAAELAVREHIRQGYKAIIARPFNHIGPGQSPDFVTASFARQIAAIESGLQEPVLNVGSLETARDFLDVRDVCSAYIKLLALPISKTDDNIYNICSGQAWKISSILGILKSQCKLPIKVVADSSKFRPSDIPVAKGDCQHIYRMTSWRPQHALEDSLKLLLDDWRKRLNVTSIIK